MPLSAIKAMIATFQPTAPQAVVHAGNAIDKLILPIISNTVRRAEHACITYRIDHF